MPLRIPNPMAIIKNPFARNAVFILGLSSLALGLAGVFLPVLPTTPFILLAAWCFLRSSEKAHRWLAQHRVLGKILGDWERHQAISRPVKCVAILMIAVSLAFIWINVEFVILKYALTLLMIGVSIFIATRNEKRE